MNVFLYGVAYEHGWDVSSEGHIRAAFSLDSLAAPLKRLMRNDVPDSTPIYQAAEQLLFTEAQELFLLACGVENSDSLVAHGAMYLECGWAPAGECALVYHKDPHGFVWDFAYSYAQIPSRYYASTAVCQYTCAVGARKAGNPCQTDS